MFTETTDYEREQISLRIAEGEWGGQAVQRYEIKARFPIAPVIVYATTNDDNDDGYPDGNWENWEMQFHNLESALRFTGKCRVGISGVIVTVTLNGKELR